jgi:hypothetical protein
MSNDERERARRIQEAQIKSRDPGPSKIRNYDWSKQKAAPKRKSLLIEILEVFPQRYKGAAIGVILGLIVAAIIALAAPEVAVLGLAVLLVFGIVGWVLGSSLQ